jgi:hypothetical protein
MDTTSMPAALMASNARGPVLNVNCLPTGDPPPLVTAVSRLATVRSALERMSVTGPKTDAGSASNRDPVGPSKFMSPAKAMVTGLPDPRIGSRPSSGLVVVVIAASPPVEPGALAVLASEGVAPVDSAGVEAPVASEAVTSADVVPPQATRDRPPNSIRASAPRGRGGL